VFYSSNHLSSSKDPLHQDKNHIYDTNCKKQMLDFVLLPIHNASDNVFA
ncbi:uncharacterized protein METZ01_LOCUS89906, partial [marine metagenome]